MNDDGKSIKIEIPPLEKVSTTQGDFYTHHIRVSDLEKFSQYLGGGAKKEEFDLKKLGEFALKVLVSAEDKSPYTPALTEDVYGKLLEDDIERLAVSVANACDVGPLSSGNCLVSLGSAIYDELSDFSKKQAEQAKRIREIISKNFGSLSSPVQGTIGERLKQIGSITEGLRSSSTFQSIQQLRDKYSNILGEGLSSRLDEVTRAEGIISQAGSLCPSSDVPENTEIPLVSTMDFTGKSAVRAANASEETVQQLREVAGLTAQMAEQIGTLHTIFLTQVLPEWKNSLQENAANANRSLRHAVWALMVSIAVAIGTTGIQLWVSHQYKIESDSQQTEVESVLRQQLEVLRSLNEQSPQNYSGQFVKD